MAFVGSLRGLRRHWYSLRTRPEAVKHACNLLGRGLASAGESRR